MKTRAKFPGKGCHRSRALASSLRIVLFITSNAQQDVPFLCSTKVIAPSSAAAISARGPFNTFSRASLLPRLLLLLSARSARSLSDISAKFRGFRCWEKFNAIHLVRSCTLNKHLCRSEPPKLDFR